MVLDYVWGAPAESLIEAISQKGLQHTSSRIRYLQVGSTAGPKISLPAEALRSSGLELLGSGFGSVPIELILQAVSEFFAEELRASRQFKGTAPLRCGEALEQPGAGRATGVSAMRFAALLCFCPLFAQVPDRVPPKRSSQIENGFGINSDLPRDPFLPWDRWWWTRMFDAGVS